MKHHLGTVQGNPRHIELAVLIIFLMRLSSCRETHFDLLPKDRKPIESGHGIGRVLKIGEHHEAVGQAFIVCFVFDNFDLCDSAVGLEKLLTTRDRQVRDGGKDGSYQKINLSEARREIVHDEVLAHGVGHIFTKPLRFKVAVHLQLQHAAWWRVVTLVA
jgi:hypothetical protein